MDNIQSISVFDGRYSRYTSELKDIFSEYGLIKHRVYVEIQWLKFLFNELNLESIKQSDLNRIDSIASDFDPASAGQVKEIEKSSTAVPDKFLSALTAALPRPKD